MYESRKQAPIGRKNLPTASPGICWGRWRSWRCRWEGHAGLPLPGATALARRLLDAAMLLGGMGPVHPPQSAPGKLFAGLYALYAGLVFIVTAALLFTPLLHRLLHRFQWDE